MKLSAHPTVFIGSIEWDEYEGDIVAFLIAADAIQFDCGAKLSLTIGGTEFQVESWFLDGFYGYIKCVAERGPASLSGAFAMEAQGESGALVVDATKSHVRVSVEAPDGVVHREVLQLADWSEFLIQLVNLLAGRLDPSSLQFAEQLCAKIRTSFT